MGIVIDGIECTQREDGSAIHLEGADSQHIRYVKNCFKLLSNYRA